MAPNKDNDDTSDDEHDNSSTQRKGLLGQLRTLFETLAEIEKEDEGHRSGSGQIDRGPTRVDYNYDVSIGLGRSTRLPDTEAASRYPEWRLNNQQATDDSVPVEVREGANEDELIIIADLPGVVDADDVETDVEPNEPALSLRVNENEWKRIPLDESNLTITDTTINNQVLEIRLSHAADANGGTPT